MYQDEKSTNKQLLKPNFIKLFHKEFNKIGTHKNVNIDMITLQILNMELAEFFFHSYKLQKIAQIWNPYKVKL